MSSFVFTRFDYPNATQTQFSDINNSGVIVGSYHDNIGDHGFIDNSGKLTAIDYPKSSAYNTHAVGINDAGEVVGDYFDSGFTLGYGHTQTYGLTYNDGSYSSLYNDPKFSSQFQESKLADVNSLGEFVGYSPYYFVDGRAFTYANEVVTPLFYPGSSSTEAHGVNDGGVVVGFYHLVDSLTGSDHGFSYSNGVYTPINIPGSSISKALGINNEGQIVGSYNDATGAHGFLDNNGTYTKIDVPGAQSTVAQGINDRGEIVGVYYDENGGHAFTTTHYNEVYRFFDTHTGDHFYTTSADEAAQIKATIPFYNFEGVSWATPDKEVGTEDVFRFFDTKSGTHFYTADVGERDQIVHSGGTYQYEGVAFQAYTDPASAGSGAITLERFFDTKTGAHHMAGNAAEAYGINHGAAGPGWVDEGPTFTVHSADGLVFA